MTTFQTEGGEVVRREQCVLGSKLVDARTWTLSTAFSNNCGEGEKRRWGGIRCVKWAKECTDAEIMNEFESNVMHKNQ